MSDAANELSELAEEIAVCRRCERLVAWREAVAADPPKRYRGEEYWARPVPGFGDPDAAIVFVGLAPAAHGANRTGRMFTGDRSGDFLYASLFRTGFANQPTSVTADDGLELRDLYISAAVRCAPPANKPTPTERDTCLPYLVRELDILQRVHVVVVLGAFAYEAMGRVLAAAGSPLPTPRPKFTHGLEVPTARARVLGCFHPSQQNTFTGKLTESMIDNVFHRARELAEAVPSCP